MKKAIFLDRDGTINEEVSFLKDVKDLKLIPGAAEALLNFKNLGYLNVVVSNQSGIARALITEEELTLIHHKLNELLTVNGVKLIDDILYSPYHSEGIIEKFKMHHEDRKPGTGMILKAKEKHNIDLNNSYLAGDKLSDIQCAEAAGVKKILVLSGYGKEELEKCKEENLEIDIIAKNLLEASRLLKSKN
jgi:D-glycero-D-manno-heptose 1,7-bisphosphate phosphatase